MSKVRHVLGISGGKDSAALAIYIKDNYPDIHEKIELNAPKKKAFKRKWWLGE